LRLPDYSTEQILREKILYAINSNAGFEMVWIKLIRKKLVLPLIKSTEFSNSIYKKSFQWIKMI
jgi:hypothetical protein